MSPMSMRWVLTSRWCEHQGLCWALCCLSSPSCCIFSSRLPPLLECTLSAMGPPASPWALPSAQTLPSPDLGSSWSVHLECSSPVSSDYIPLFLQSLLSKAPAPRRLRPSPQLESISPRMILLSSPPVMITTFSELQSGLKLSLVSTVALGEQVQRTGKQACPEILAHVITPHAIGLTLPNCSASWL